MRAVFAVVEHAVIDGFGESGPSAARIKLVGREEKGFARGYIHVDAVAKFGIVFVVERLFGGALLCNLVLQGCEFAS